MDQAGGGGRSPVRVTIFNQSYSLLATSEPGETEEIAQMVHDLMCSIAAKAGNIDSTRIAVLASLHLADRLRTLEKELDGLRQRVDQKTRHITELLDRVIE